MKYALNLSENNRILSACIVLPRGIYVGQPMVDKIRLFNDSSHLDVT